MYNAMIFYSAGEFDPVRYNYVTPILHRFRDINTYLPKKLRRHVTVTTLAWGIVCHHTTNTSRRSRANPCTKFDDSIFSYCREI